MQWETVWEISADPAYEFARFAATHWFLFAATGLTLGLAAWLSRGLKPRALAVTTLILTVAGTVHVLLGMWVAIAAAAFLIWRFRSSLAAGPPAAWLLRLQAVLFTLVLAVEFTEAAWLFHAANGGPHSVAEGRVRNFTSARESERSGLWSYRAESVTVTGVRFSYHHKWPCTCYNRTAMAGGRMKNGLPVRISYVVLPWAGATRIVRIEIRGRSDQRSRATRKPPSNPVRVSRGRLPRMAERSISGPSAQPPPPTICRKHSPSYMGEPSAGAPS